MHSYEITPDTVMPSVEFIYGPDCAIAGEKTPLVGPIVQAFIDGDIDVERYAALCEEENRVNQTTRDFMYNDVTPDFMPKIPAQSKWRTLFRGILEVM